MQTIKEWEFVQELYDMIDELETVEQQNFVKDLYDNLDPHLPFLEQQSAKQEKWLNVLYEYYCNGDEDAFEENFE